MEGASTVARSHTSSRKRGLARLVIALSVGVLYFSVTPRQASAATHIPTTTYNSNMTWTVANSPYVLDGNVTVGAGATLTIQPGVVVKFNGAARTLFVNGSLLATAPNARPIYFTSLQDDSIAGDTGADGPSVGAPGQWSQIKVGSTSNSLQLRNAVIRYGGTGTGNPNAELWIGSTAAAAISETQITQSKTTGLTVFYGLATISHSTINANVKNGIYVDHALVAVDHTRVESNGEWGVELLINSAPYTAASTFYDNNVTANGLGGIWMWGGSGTPASSWPYGSRNNIFDNKVIDLNGHQLYNIGLSHSTSVDWSENYWGSGLRWVPNCGTGYLSYNTGGSPPKAPTPLFWWGIWPSTDCYVNLPAIDAGGWSTVPFEPFGPPVDPSLLRYAPELRYDAQETYRAASPAEITDNYQAGWQNLLQDPNEVVLAAADPVDEHDDLSLDYLDVAYPSGVDAQDGDHIDEADHYVDDAQRMQALPQYANRMYGHSVTHLDGSKTLQYWFFYYYNPKTFDFIGAHEGDWEMVQIDVSPDGTPGTAAYAQHTAGEVCSWDRVEKTPDGHPVVYIADGSHASYFTAGDHVIPGGAGYTDDADGAGARLTPDVIDLDAEQPGWLAWPGHWGASNGFAASPSGPQQHEHATQWWYPDTWQATTATNPCSAPSFSSLKSKPGSSTAALHATPRLPLLHASLRRNHVVISYAFSSMPQDRARRPWQLLTSVLSTDSRYAPYTKRTVVSRRTGHVVQKLGAGHGPYRLLISVRSRLGTHTETVKINLHP